MNRRRLFTGRHFILTNPQPPTLNPLLRTIPYFQRAKPIRSGNVNRVDLQSMPLSVFNYRSRVIETHWLIVQQRSGERREIMALQMSARVGDQREARGVRFGETIQRERSDRLHDFVLSLAGDSVGF